MKKVWLGLGSNLGDSRYILQRAWEALGEESSIRLLSFSSPYASAPVGMKSENRFLNAVGILETTLDPYSLLKLLQNIEKGFGRQKKTGLEGYQDRLLDLDILYFGDRLSLAADLQLPHPHIANRLFVLAPLAEIDPEHCDPCSGKKVEDMYAELNSKIANGVMASQDIVRETWF
jgi:2-amino-4-hydroxy-6-hydroxymethyldihydropteridine diphosphokinase